jgi:hypothetical protein
MGLISFAELKQMGSLARGYLWDVTFNLPAGVTGDQGMLRLRARRVSIPSREFAPLIDPFQALESTDTGAPTYNHDCNITFTENSKGDVSNIIEQWLNLSYNPENPNENKEKDDRVKTITLSLYGLNGSTIMRQYELVNAQPRNNTTGTELQYEDKAAKVEFTVTFLFDYYRKSK